MLAQLVLTISGVTATASAQTEIVEYYGQDALGSIRIVFDATGAAVARADYEPFGELFVVPNMPGTSGLPAKQFTGQERDAEASLDYYGARFFLPRTGRFSQVDPVDAGLFDPQRWNRYAYVRNSPNTFVDPDGRMMQAPVQPWDCPRIYDKGPAFCQLWGGGTDFGGSPEAGWMGWDFGQGGGGHIVDGTAGGIGGIGDEEPSTPKCGDPGQPACPTTPACGAPGTPPCPCGAPGQAGCVPVTGGTPIERAKVEEVRRDLRNRLLTFGGSCGPYFGGGQYTATVLNRTPISLVSATPSGAPIAAVRAGRRWTVQIQSGGTFFSLEGTGTTSLALLGHDLKHVLGQAGQDTRVEGYETTTATQKACPDPW